MYIVYSLFYYYINLTINLKMTLYLNYNIDTKSEQIQSSQWSNTDIQVLATVTNKNRITFFQDEAIGITEHDIIKDKAITAFTWHPFEMMIIYGFEDGRLGFWVDDNNFTKEENAIHEGKITIIKFNNIGNRIVSVDSTNSIIVWNFDGNLHRLCNYKQNYTIEDLFFPCFNVQRYKDLNKVPPEESLNNLFFYHTSAGMIYLADDSDSSPEICRVSGKVKCILFHEAENSIILITSNMLLVKCVIYFTEQLSPKKLKLSLTGNCDNIRCCWAGDGLLAIINNDDKVRFYYLENDRNYFVHMSDHYSDNTFIDDCFTCIDYSFRKRTLVVGTKGGKIYMWKCNLTASVIPVSADAWEPFCVVDSIQNLLSIKWSTYMGLIHLSAANNVNAMLSETILQKKMNNVMKIVQTSHKTIEVIVDEGIGKFEANNIKKIEMNDTIKGLELFNNRFIFWNGIYAHIHEVGNNMLISKISSVKIKSNMLALNEDSIVVANSKTIEVLSYEGAKKNEVKIESKYGEVTHFQTINRLLLVITSNGFFAIFDIHRRTFKTVLNYRKFEKEGKKIGEIREGAVNTNGTRIAFLCDQLVHTEQRIPETSFYVYDCENDTFSDFEISSHRIPIEIQWDYNDPRVFGIHTDYAKDYSDINNDINLNDSKKDFIGQEFYMFFYTQEFGIKQQECHKINRDLQGVFCVCLPNIYFIVQKNSTSNSIHSLQENKFQFFQGMTDIPDDIKNALIEFSIFMSSGKIDEAYKIVKNIKSYDIWTNMAKVCIKSKRLDVLEICLSNMRFATGIKALRESAHEKEPEARLAQVAMHLNLIDEAKILLEEIKRYDILIRFYIGIGEYDQAIDLAKKKNRINLENTYYRIAQHYERNNNIDKAMDYYKKSGCGAREIPRMLIQKCKIDLLEKYMSVGEDIHSQLWWAAYLESKGELDKAKQYYEKAKDWTNVVRILLAMNKILQAKAICDDTKDSGACFLMGRYYESIGEIKLAIYYYALSGRINQAFRLAKDNNMDGEIYNLGLKASNMTQNLIAEHFEKKGNPEKAINLYLLANNIKSALNLCLSTNNYEKVKEIAENIELQNDPEMHRKLAEYFIEQKQYEKALGIFIKLKDWEKSLDICDNYKINISISTANNILSALDTIKDSSQKEKLTLQLAQQLKQQGDFELAHKIYVKIGDMNRAMKCLIKMGNKEKIIDFANVSRNNELFILAANYLETLDCSEEIVADIVKFFTKAKAWTNLSSFYELFASIEIQDYKNYEKAIEIYGQAIKVLDKMTDNEKKQKKLEILTNKIKITKIYSNAYSMSKTSPEDALGLCNQLLNKKSVDDVVREGDIYALMLDIYKTNQNYPACYSVLEVLKSLNKNLTNFVDARTIKVILESVGKVDRLDEYVQTQQEDDIAEEIK